MYGNIIYQKVVNLDILIIRNFNLLEAMPYNY